MVLTVTAVVLVVLWRWVDGLSLSDSDKKAAAQLDVVKVASGIAVGGGGLFALYLAARRQRTQELELAQRDRAQAHIEWVAENTRRHAERTAAAAEQDAAERRVTELYAKSLEHLGSESAPVRLGGLYALDRLADGSPEHRQTVIDVLCAYLRMPHLVPDETGGKEWVQEREVRLTAQRLLASRLRTHDLRTAGRPTNPKQWPGDHDVDLTGATLIDVDLSGCTFGTATFTGATFVGQSLLGFTTFVRGATFDRARFEGRAWFEEACFNGVGLFVETTFSGTAAFDQARFTTSHSFYQAQFAAEAAFSGAVFDGISTFQRAQFTQVTFHAASFTAHGDFIEVKVTGDASFWGAAFAQGACFDGAEFGGRVDLSGTTARVDSEDGVRRELSVWPSGWRVVEFVNPSAEPDGRWARLEPDS